MRHAILVCLVALLSCRATRSPRRGAVGAAVGTVSPTDPIAQASTIAGCQVFPTDNPWNRDVSGDPVDPRSDAYIANIQAHGNTSLKADFGSNPDYGIPFVTVPASQPMVPIRFTEYGDESDPGPYPVPPNAPIEAGGDHHVLVLQQSRCRLFELYHARREGSGWAAGSGAVFDLGESRLRPRGWTSCDQAGLPILPGLTRYEEARSGAIHHALRVTFEHTQSAWIEPATHPGGGQDPDAPPMGLRLRLKSSYDISRFTGFSRSILVALKRYGLITADTGSSWYISGTTDPRWDDDDLQQLNQVSGTAFEVVHTGTLQRQR